MQKLESIIAGHPFFEGLAPDYVELIAGCASNVRFDTGSFIFREGEEANQFYIIRQGKVAIDIFIPGRNSFTVQTINEGEVLGWAWLFPPYRWHFDARAIELTRATAFDGRCLRGKCEEDHHLGYELMKRFSHIMVLQLHATQMQLLDIYSTNK